MIGEKVLIVEDNEDFARDLESILDSCGYEVETILNGEGAFEAARRANPQVVLLDLRLGAVSGFTVAAQLKGAQETAAIPVIAMSGHFPIELSSSLLDMSAVDARLKKPFSILELVGQIERLLNSKQDIPGAEPGFEKEAKNEECYA